MSFFSKIFRRGRRREQRNYAQSDMFLDRLPMPVFTNWTVRKAVKDGFRASGWVYRAVNLISKNAASASWSVSRDGERLPDHHLSRLLKYPNPHISRQDMLELMTCWLELAGNSYLLRVQANGQTTELWPVSPDRLRPIPGQAVAEWCRGFALDNATRPTFGPEEIVHHRFLDPANPLIGISPLEVAGRAVDIDVSQQKFNAATSQNRGIIDGVFFFDREFATQDDADALAEKIEEKYSGKRRFVVLGKNGKYERIAMTPAEMDFTESRKFNREEVCVIFGVPLPLISPEKTTYNNYQTAEEMLWTMTIIPLLDDIADGFNHAFSGELADGESLLPDLSRVPAIRRMLLKRSETAEKLHNMGVPFSQINRIFDFGVNEYPGWDVSSPKNRNTEPDATRGFLPGDREARANTGSFNSVLRFTLRSGSGNIAESLDRLTEEETGPVIAALLANQKTAVFRAIEDGKSAAELEAIVTGTRADWETTLRAMYLDVAIRYGREVVVETRDIDDPLSRQLTDYFEHESFLLTEVAHIESTTVNTILAQMRDALNDGATIAEMQQAIVDTGVFEPVRAARIARTVSGTAASIGQHSAAKTAGAQNKTWDAAPGARKEHAARSGETVPIDSHFSPAFGESVGPRYPMDPYLPAADRMSCRCSMTFSDVQPMPNLIKI